MYILTHYFSEILNFHFSKCLCKLVTSLLWVSHLSLYWLHKPIDMFYNLVVYISYNMVTYGLPDILIYTPSELESAAHKQNMNLIIIHSYVNDVMYLYSITLQCLSTFTILHCFCNFYSLNILMKMHLFHL